MQGKKTFQLRTIRVADHGSEWGNFAFADRSTERLDSAIDEHVREKRLDLTMTLRSCRRTVGHHSIDQKHRNIRFSIALEPVAVNLGRRANRR
jgi:hypothetical protein